MMCLTLIWTMYLLCNFIGINIINQYVSMRHHLIVDFNYVSVRNSLLDASFCIRIINHYVSISLHSLVDVSIGIKIIYHYVSKRHHSFFGCPHFHKHKYHGILETKGAHNPLWMPLSCKHTYFWILAFA